jgi:hypothetical protein
MPMRRFRPAAACARAKTPPATRAGGPSRGLRVTRLATARGAIWSALAALALALSPPAGAVERSAPPPPVLVELFTSQGCSSCVEANALLGALARRPDVIALTYAVGYWDYLGWRDTFAKPEFATRQRAYAASLRRTSVYTPEIVVNGTGHAQGADRAKVLALVAAGGAPAPARIAMQGEDDVIVSGPSPQAPADVWLIQYRPQPAYVAIKHGENAGVTMPHFNVVTNVQLLGQWRGGALRFNAACDGACVVVVQLPRGGAVLAAHQV